jgi:hypothetical protein
VATVRISYMLPAGGADRGAPRTPVKDFLPWAGPVRRLCFFFLLFSFSFHFLFLLYFTLVFAFFKFENCSDFEFCSNLKIV